MGLGILTNANFGAGTLPVFGNLNYASNLLLAYRPNSVANFDLSDNENSVVVGTTGKVNQNGFTGFGTGAAVTSVKSNSTDMTIIVCAKIKDLVSGVNNRTWLASSYNSSPISGIGLLVTADMISGQTNQFNVKLRTYVACKNTDSNAYQNFPFPTDLVINANLAASETGYIYVVARIDATNKYIDHQILNLSQYQKREVGSATLNLADRNQVNEGSWKIGGTNGGAADTAPANVLQCLIFDRALTDSEIAKQYSDDKRWILAEHGVAL